MWTVLFVVVNQIAYTVVVRLASSGTANAVTQTGGDAGTGYTIYSSAFLVMMVPHSIATVSLACQSPESGPLIVWVTDWVVDMPWK